MFSTFVTQRVILKLVHRPYLRRIFASLPLYIYIGTTRVVSKSLGTVEVFSHNYIVYKQAGRKTLAASLRNLTKILSNPVVFNIESSPPHVIHVYV